MGIILTIGKTPDVHSLASFCDARSSSPAAAGAGAHNGGTPRPWLQASGDTAPSLMPSVLPLSNSWGSSQLRDPLPSIHKVSPPPVKHRDFYPKLTPLIGHLRCNQPDGPPNPFDVLLSIKGWQHQVPDPKRQVVGQLSTKQINPVRHPPQSGWLDERGCLKGRRPDS